MTAELVKKVTYFGECGVSEQFLYQKKYYSNVFEFLERYIHAFVAKLSVSMFLLLSGRHVGAHPDRHQHGVSIQLSINLGKKFLRISCIRKITVT